jgi:hypothetical protein
MDNETRATKALVAAHKHIEDAGSIEDGLVDLAVNILHACDLNGIDLVRFTNTVYMHHEAEVQGIP